MSIELFKHIYFRLPIVLRLLITIFIIMIFFGAVIHLIEPEQFPSIFDGIWWAFVTGATVGYGDYVPLTVLGKTTGILLILSGDRKSTRLNSSHVAISYAVFCLKKKRIDNSE